VDLQRVLKVGGYFVVISSRRKGRFLRHREFGWKRIHTGHIFSLQYSSFSFLFFFSYLPKSPDHVKNPFYLYLMQKQSAEAELTEDDLGPQESDSDVELDD
jgi:hypothetical protein